MEAPLRHAIVAASVAALGVTGCLGSDDPDADRAAPVRVDSASRFGGTERAVARTVESYEAAVLAGDVERLCRVVLAVRENHGNDNDNGGRAYCERARPTSPRRVLARAGGEGAFDIVVRHVDVERGRRHVRARAVSSVAGGPEVFELERARGRWRITAHSFGRLPSDRAGLPLCEHIAGADLSLGAALDAETPREALVQGPFGDRIRRTLRNRGALTLAAVSYRPDYLETWALRGAHGRVLRQYPVTVWGPRSFDTSTVVFCNGDGDVLRAVL
jgi:hypothetical protein